MTKDYSQESVDVLKLKAKFEKEEGTRTDTFDSYVRTSLICLSELFEITIEPQTIWSAVGLHGAGGYLIIK